MNTHPDIVNLGSREQKIQAAAKLVTSTGGKSKGVNAHNIRNWVNPNTLQKLQDACAQNPKHLGPDGKHKGGRGIRKAGFKLTSRENYTAWFPNLEQDVLNRLLLDRQKRIRVHGRDIKQWMQATVSDAARQDRDANDSVLYKERLEKFKCSSGWLSGFLKRHGLVRRRATNKRSHSVEDLLGDVLGFVRFLRELRQNNPSDEDEVLGIYNLYTTFNVDSVPLPFCSVSKTTIDKHGATRVSIICAGSGLDKRQATLHLCIRPFGEQPWPTIILKGAMTKDGKEDTKKRAEEMEKFAQYKVHVLWQDHAWLDEALAVTHWIPSFKQDLARIGLSSSKILLLSDNLDAQKTDTYTSTLANDLNCLCVYGPKNGTDVWQPVDHGVGQRYQSLIAGFYDDWTRSTECIDLFRQKKGPCSARRRELMVTWTHQAYEQTERLRIEKEEEGKHSLFMSAFLRPGTLVSANGSALDDEMNPEGVVAAMATSTDSYYKDYSITTFRQLLRCSDGSCGHNHSRDSIPGVTAQQQKLDAAKVKEKLSALTASTDPRARLIVKCLENGMQWAGSSFIVFLSQGVEKLLSFLSETDDHGQLAHDVDLYRLTEATKELGQRFVTNIWNFPKPKTQEHVKAGAVNKITLTLSKTVGSLETGSKLAVDQVNLFKSKMKPSTDIWPNLCCSASGESLQIGNLFQNQGVPLEVSLHNALLIGSEENVPCYVLRKAAMPTYVDGVFVSDDSYCDGRFRGKLHQRQTSKIVSLRPCWQPGPIIAPPETFMVSNPGSPPTGEVGDDNALADLLDDLEVSGEDSEDGDELEVRFSNFNSIAWSLPRNASAEERRDWAYARQVARQNENFGAANQAPLVDRQYNTARPRRNTRGVYYGE
jgi:hypothetical protein